MEERKLNISLIKEMVFQEIVSYDKKLKDKVLLDSDIDNLNLMIRQLETKDFDAIFEHIIFYETMLPGYYSIENLGSKKVVDKFYDNVHTCMLYTQNPDRYSKENYEIALKSVDAVKSFLESVLTKKIVEQMSCKPDITLSEYIEFKRILSNFKFKRLINGNQYDLLKKLFLEKKLTPKEQIILNEAIRTYNVKIHYNEEHKALNNYTTYQILNMLNTGFEDIKISHVNDSERKNQLDNLIKSIIIIANTDIKEIEVLLPVYEGNLTFKEGYLKEEVLYLYENLLLHYQEQMYNDVKEMEDLENYKDRECRNLIVEDYNENLIKYKYIRNIMNKQFDDYENDLNKLEEEPNVNNLYYLTTGDTKTYFESDLKDLPKDRYKEIKELLIRFKKGLLSKMETKTLNEYCPGLLEIRADQIRIMYKRIKENDFIIVGVFLKKTDMSRYHYDKYNHRNLSNYISGDEIEEELFSMIEKNKHSGGRTNS